MTRLPDACNRNHRRHNVPYSPCISKRAGHGRKHDMYGLFIDFAWELLQRYSLRLEKRNKIEHNDTVHRRFDPMNRYGNRPLLLLYSHLGWS